MDKGFSENLLNVCDLLKKNKVQYLIVGGTAVDLHGYYRLSTTHVGNLSEKPDIDIWYNPSYKNYFNLLKALEGLKVDITEFKKEMAPNPRKSFFKLDCDTFTIDFLPELPGLQTFAKSYKKKDITHVEDVELMFINYDDLISNKLSTAREKDLKDVIELKKKHDNKL